MNNGLPTEAEVAAFARATNAYDEDGRCKVSRAQLVKGTQLWLQGRAEAEEHARTSTARFLVQFEADLIAEGVDEASAREIMKSTAPALVRRTGLATRENGPATHE